MVSKIKHQSEVRRLQSEVDEARWQLNLAKTEIKWVQKSLHKAEADVAAARGEVRRLQELQSLLLELEPTLDKYRRDGAEGRRVFDTDSMRRVAEFRRAQATSKRWLESPGVRV